VQRAFICRSVYADAVSSSRNIASSSRPTKQSPQPDVISTSITDEHTCAEIARLEALCDSKTNQLSVISAALRERTKRFEAMTVIAQYFIEQVCLVV